MGARGHHNDGSPVLGAEIGRELLVDVPLAEAPPVVSAHDAAESNREGCPMVDAAFPLASMWRRLGVALLLPLLLEHLLVLHGRGLGAVLRWGAAP